MNRRYLGSAYRKLKQVLPVELKHGVRTAFERRGLPLGLLKNRVKQVIQRRDLTALADLVLPRVAAGPLISVIVPVYNHSQYLRLCFESLAAQTYRNFEVIVIDDHSTEPGVTEILSQYLEHPHFRVYYNDRNRGISYTLNQGIKHARGEYVALVDCDDLLYPYSLMEVVREINRHPGKDYFFTDRAHVDEAGREVERVHYGNLPQLIGRPHASALWRGMYASHLKVIKRSAFERFGLHDSFVDGCQDYDLALRFAEHGELHYIPQVLYQHRWHPASVTLSSNRKQQRISAHVLRQSVRRRYLNSCECLDMANGDDSLSMLYVVPYLVVGGAEQVLYQLLQEVSAQDDVRAVHVFCELGQGAWWERFAELPKLSLHFLGGEEVGAEEKLRYLMALAARERITTVHISNSKLGYEFAERLHRFWPRPLVLDTIHSDRSGALFVSEDYKAFLDQRVAVCRAAKIRLCEKTGEDWFRIRTVYNGTRPRSSVVSPETVRERWAIPHDARVVTFIGRLSTEKDPLILPTIATQVRGHHPDTIFLVLGDGPERERLAEAIAAVGLSDAFRLVGATDEVGDALSVSDMLLLPSLTEGHPLVLIEAMLAEVPVVASRVGGIPEVLTHGKSGLLASPSDVVGFARHVTTLLSDRGLRTRLTTSAKRLAEARYNSGRMANSYLTLYRRGLRRLASEGGRKLVSIVILSFNRYHALKRCIEAIDTHTKLPFELIILDNGSTHQATLDYCRQLANRPDATVIFEDRNHGCSIGRKRALVHARGDYIVTLDNDIEVTPGWLEALILRVEEDPRIAAACSKVVNPDGRIEFNGGDWELDEPFVRFFLRHNGLPEASLEAQERRDCPWIPGGATLIKREAAQHVEHSDEFPNAFEDNDYSLQLTRKGYRLVNCPESRLVHHHRSFMSEDERQAEREYVEARERRSTITDSLLAFYRRTGLAIYDPNLFHFLGLPALKRNAELLSFYESAMDSQSLRVGRSETLPAVNLDS